MNDETIANQNLAGINTANIEVSEDSPQNNGEEKSMKSSENDGREGLDQLLFIEQYTSLRSEIEKRIDIRQQLLALTLIIAGSFLTIGIQGIIPIYTLLCYPFIAMFLGAIWEHNDLRIGQLSWYIQANLEPYLGKFGPGWEIYRRSHFIYNERKAKKNKSILNNAETQLGASRSLILFATRGIFGTTQIASIILSLGRYFNDLWQQNILQRFSNESLLIQQLPIVLLFILDMGLTVFTIHLVRHRRIRL